MQVTETLNEGLKHEFKISVPASDLDAKAGAKLTDMMRNGKRPEAALCALPIIPQKYHWIIKVYAMSEDAAKVYEDIAVELTNNVEEFVTKLFGHVATGMKFAVGLLIIWIYGALNDIADFKVFFFY